MSGRRHRAGASPRWVPVDQLSELARSLLSEDLGGRDAVPAQVAARVTALAEQWMEHGFTPENMRPWAELTPAGAAYLVRRGVDPDVLNQLIDIGTIGPVTLRRAIATGQLDVERAYELLVATGVHQVPAGERSDRPDRSQPAPAPFASAPFASPPERPAPDPARTPPSPAPALFSHPTTDSQAERDRELERAERRRASGPPSRTPFRP